MIDAAPRAKVDPRPIELPIIDGTDRQLIRPSPTSRMLQTAVRHIVQDDQGFMWFGTTYGLNRYDGYSFKVFVHDASSFSGDDMRSSGEDRRGTFWVASAESLDEFDRRAVHLAPMADALERTRRRT